MSYIRAPTHTKISKTSEHCLQICHANRSGVVFIDLTKAFDTTDHEIILCKMSYLGVQQAAIKWFSSYFSGRTQRCNVNGKLSTARTLSCGVPQGSILGPLLFLIYINDLPNSLQNAVPRMFADDTNPTLSAKTLTELELTDFSP